MTAKVIIKNGTVINLENNTSEIKDIYIKNGTFNCQETENKEDFVYDASGQYVVPGLIDFHTHVFTHATEIGINPDLTLIPNGITTTVDAGSAGVSNMQDFLNNIINRATVNIKAFINLSSTGIPTIKYPENVDPIHWDKERLLYFLQTYPKIICGLKIRISKDIVGSLGLSVLEKAIEIAEELHTPLAVHITNPPAPMRDVAKLLRPGDILVHCFHNTGFSILDKNGKIFPEVIAAQNRGVLFDAANGRIHWSFHIAERALAQGFKPDIISSDIIQASCFRPPVFSLPYLMTKYLMLGLSFYEVLKACTVTPAKALNAEHYLGKIISDDIADVAVLALKNHTINFSDFEGVSKSYNKMLINMLTIRSGKIVYRNPDSL